MNGMGTQGRLVRICTCKIAKARVQVQEVTEI